MFKHSMLIGEIARLHDELALDDQISYSDYWFTLTQYVGYLWT
jgi:hypothetical protein